MLRAVRVAINGFSFVVLMLLAATVMPANPLLGVVFALAALDQLEDVYYYTYRRRLIPRWLMPVDIVFEGIMFVVGLAMFVFSVVYWSRFETPLFKALLFVSVAVMYSAVEDVAEWFRVRRGGGIAVREAAFVRRRL